VRGRQREFGEGRARRIEAADLRRAAFAEPQAAVGPFDRDIRLAAFGRDAMFADDGRGGNAGAGLRLLLDCTGHAAMLAGPPRRRNQRGRDMPKLDGVLETALYTDDMERARAFYEAVLGLVPT